MSDDFHKRMGLDREERPDTDEVNEPALPEVKNLDDLKDLLFGGNAKHHVVMMGPNGESISDPDEIKKMLDDMMNGGGKMFGGQVVDGKIVGSPDGGEPSEHLLEKLAKMAEASETQHFYELVERVQLGRRSDKIIEQLAGMRKDGALMSALSEEGDKVLKSLSHLTNMHRAFVLALAAGTILAATYTNTAADLGTPYEKLDDRGRDELAAMLFYQHSYFFEKLFFVMRRQMLSRPIEERQHFVTKPGEDKKDGAK